MNEFSVPMALVDYIPVVLFALAIITLLKDFRHNMSKISLVLFAAGGILITCAGGFKATYKLIYALGTDVPWMSAQFFTNQAFGFLFAGAGLMLSYKSKKAYGFIPVMGLVGIMIIGMAAMDAALCSIASKLKQKKAIVLFVVSFFFELMMGYLSSRDFSQAYMNWIAQAINCAGMLMLYLGVRMLHNNGLEKY